MSNPVRRTENDMFTKILHTVRKPHFHNFIVCNVIFKLFRFFCFVFIVWMLRNGATQTHISVYRYLFCSFCLLCCLFLFLFAMRQCILGWKMTPISGEEGVILNPKCSVSNLYLWLVRSPALLHIHHSSVPNQIPGWAVSHCWRVCIMASPALYSEVSWQPFWTAFW